MIYLDYKLEKAHFDRSSGLQTAVTAVAHMGKAFFVLQLNVQTRLMGQYNGK